MQRTTRSAFSLTFLLLASLPNTALSQTLDEAITERLGVVGDNILGFCDSLGGSGIASSTSGGTSLPVSIPVLAQQRLRAANTRPEPIKRNRPTRLSSLQPDEQPNFVSSRFTPFVLFDYERLQRQASRYENSRDSARLRFSIGTWFRFSSGSTGGLSVSTTTSDGELGDRADFDNSSLGLNVFTSVKVGNTGAIQLGGSFFGSDNERLRRAVYFGSGTRCRGSQKAVHTSEESSIDVSYRNTSELGQWTIALSAGVGWQRTHTDTYSEANAGPFFFGNGTFDELTGLELTFYEDTRDSLLSLSSVGFSRLLEFNGWIVQPTIFLQWIHEFASDQRELEASFVLDPEQRRFTYLRDAPDRDYFMVDASASMRKGSLVWLLGYRSMVGHDYLTVNVFTLGLNGVFD